jgi:ABC-type nitrate/sulfonate/bicarbonate transport system substrate-binding protein
MATKKSNLKVIIGGVVAVVVVIAVIIGANLGKTKNASPADSIGGIETVAVASTAAEQSSSAVSNAVTAGTAEQATAVAAVSSPAKELFPLKTHTRKDCTLAPVLVADKKGFFAEEGLKLVFTGELTDAEVLPSILNGNNDFADSHPNGLALKINGGAKVIGVERSIIEPSADKNIRLRHMWYYVNAKSGIKTWADFKNYKPGEKIKFGGWPNSCEDLIANKVFDKLGIPRDRFEWVTFETDLEQVQALKQGLIDATMVHPPFYDAAEEAGLVKIGDSSDSGLGEAAGAYLYYFSTKFTEEHPEQIKGFVRAMLKAQKWANANMEQTAKWTGEFIGIEVKGNHYYSETSKIDEASIKPWIDDLITNGLLKEGDPGSKVTDVITHAFESDE